MNFYNHPTLYLLMFFIFKPLTGLSDISPLCQKEVNQLSFSKNIISLNKKTLSVLTWNAHKLEDLQFFNDLVHISENIDLLFIQEAMHSMNIQDTFLSRLSFDFSFHKSFCTNNQATGVLTGSRFLQVSPRTVVSSGKEPISLTPKVSSVSYIQFQNKNILLINTHALNFNFGSDFEKQIDQIIQIISQVSHPIIWAGDFNTWSSSRKSYLINKSQKQGLTALIPKNDHRNLKLDHILVRGFQPIKTEVLNQFKSSDHKPIYTELKIE